MEQLHILGEQNQQSHENIRAMCHRVIAWCRNWAVKSCDLANNNRLIPHIPMVQNVPLPEYIQVTNHWNFINNCPKLSYNCTELPNNSLVPYNNREPIFGHDWIKNWRDNPLYSPIPDFVRGPYKQANPKRQRGHDNHNCCDNINPMVIGTI